MCKTIKLKVKFQTDPQTIYQLLTNSKKQTAFSGKKAIISTRVGGRFSSYGGNISGINVDLKPGVRVVQAWRERDFPAGIFSMATFLLKSTSRGGTELTLIHRGVPKDLLPKVEKQWRECFWIPMKEVIKT